MRSGFQFGKRLELLPFTVENRKTSLLRKQLPSSTSVRLFSSGLWLLLDHAPVTVLRKAYHVGA